MNGALQGQTAHLVVTGHPVPKGRGRAVSTHNGPRIYTPKATVNYERDIKQVARDVMGGEEPFSGPVMLTFLAVFSPAKSWPLWKRKAAFQGAVKNVRKPDVDNLVKIAQDAINGIVFIDDAQVFYQEVRKEYGYQPRIEITVKEVDHPTNQNEWKNWSDH